jgi:hypothetical protein
MLEYEQQRCSRNQKAASAAPATATVKAIRPKLKVAAKRTRADECCDPLRQNGGKCTTRIKPA